MSRPKLPESILVSPASIGVRFDKEACQAGEVTGAYLGDSGAIIVEPGNSLDVEKETVLHECLHAIWRQTALSIEYPDADKDSPGEKIISALAPRLYGLLLDNPELLRYLKGRQ